MYKVWKKKSREEIKSTVFNALKNNVNYEDQNVLGVPASYLDDKVFNQDASFILDAPFVSTLVKNPNHIGCHTIGSSESYFAGTHEIERELIEICAVDILKGNPGEHDGYVASGGTEANLQAIWVYRNFFRAKKGAALDEICILSSDDSHYSMHKASNVLVIDGYTVKVNPDTRELDVEDVAKTIEQAKSEGKKYFIVITNMMTTMFGSVDNVDVYSNALKGAGVEYKIHVDGAYGGFYYPFSAQESNLTFENPEITSFTLDAHKMAQAPYGTGIFIIRKDYIGFANTDKASYVEGEDCTLIGSRSGANAIAVWMILVTSGPFGWKEKIFVLQKRTDWICEQLDKLNMVYYRHPESNIVTIRSEYINPSVAKEFGLVPDNHSSPNWYKIVLMEHVTIEKLIEFLEGVKANPMLVEK